MLAHGEKLEKMFEFTQPEDKSVRENRDFFRKKLNKSELMMEYPF